MKRSYFIVISWISICAGFSVEGPIAASTEDSDLSLGRAYGIPRNVLRSEKISSSEDLANPVVPTQKTKEIKIIDQSIESVIARKEILAKYNDPLFAFGIAKYEEWEQELIALKEKIIAGDPLVLNSELRQIQKKYNPASFYHR